MSCGSAANASARWISYASAILRLVRTVQDNIDGGQQLLVPKKMLFTKGVRSHKHELLFRSGSVDAGIEFDEDKGWDEKEEIFRMSDKIVKTTNITQPAIVERGRYTTVVAAGVFIF